MLRTFICRGLLAGLVFALSGLAGPSLRAQDFERVAPKELPVPPRAPDVAPAPPPAAEPADPERVVLENLKGLKLIDDVKKLKREGAGTPGVTIEGLPMVEASTALQGQLAAYLDKPLTIGGLNAISQLVVGWYRENDRPFVDVAFPEQDVSTGIVQVVVTEFRVGQIKVEGNNWFSTSLIRDRVRLSQGDEIDSANLQDDLNWLNQNPFRQVSVVAEKSDTPGATDLVLKTEDRLPLRVYTSFDNGNTRILGRDRWGVGFNIGDPWFDQQLSYQFQTSDNFFHNRDPGPGQPNSPSFVAHSLNYTIPLPWRDKLNIFGSYSRVLPLLGPAVDVEGVSGQASARYIVTLPSVQSLGLTHEFQIGYDFKTSNNNAAFTADIFGFLIPLVSNVTTEITQFPFIYNASLTDDYGQTTISNSLVFSPGNVTPLNKDTAFQMQNNDSQGLTKANYLYDNLAIGRSTRLPYDASWVMRVTAQTSDRNLLPSEQIGIGGVESVRGYDERTGNGSLGIIVNQELRSPPFSLAKLLGRAELFAPPDIGDQAQVLLFYDYGAVRQHQGQLAGGVNMLELESAGIGFRYTIDRFLDVRMDYGWQLRSLPGSTLHGAFGNVSVTLGF